MRVWRDATLSKYEKAEENVHQIPENMKNQKNMQNNE
jgi:hypothetical protein